MLNSAKKILVISAHADDMELGCGGTVHKLVKAGKEVHSLVLSFNMKGTSAKFSASQIQAEVWRGAEILGLQKDRVYFADFENRIFPEHRQEILDKLWEYKNKLKPDLVITGSLDDMHQDHATVAQESYRAFKETNLISYGFDWNRREKYVNMYSPLSEEDLKKKIEAAMSYQSQVEGRNYFSEDYIRSWAVARGIEVKEKYAEAFQVVRLIYK